MLKSILIKYLLLLWLLATSGLLFLDQHQPELLIAWQLELAAWLLQPVVALLTIIFPAMWLIFGELHTYQK